MSSSQHDIFHHSYHHRYESAEDWTRPQCFETISASRPPVFNPDNCSCVETGSYSNGAEQPSSAPTYERQLYENKAPAPNVYRQPQSYASSSISVSCSEGSERDAPSVNVNNTYLTLGPETGHNETEHRRSSSFRSNMSYQMRRYIIEQELMQPEYVGDSTPSEARFLPQDVHIQSKTSMQVNKSSKRSKPSHKSLQSSTSGDASFISWGVDPVFGTGAWINEDGSRYWGDGCPMAMSGLSDCVFDD